jgi:DNA (cytosine-5)-methyltransferase 1
VGYDRAGFEVVGVDLAGQPRYPFEFHQADALDVLRAIAGGGPFRPAWLGRIDGIHLSPVCLTFARVTDWRGSRADHPDTLRPSLALLEQVRVPWVVENVPEAPLRADYMLCGSQFGLKVQRHRIFQTSWHGYQLSPPCDHRGLLPFMHKGERAYADAMGCTWMNKTEARQAIPPAYGQYLGERMLEHLVSREAA